jgi:threonine synthase
MRFVSTRGVAPEVGFVEAMLGGLAPDGGLYSPQTWPQFSRDDIAAFAGQPYAIVAAKILGAFAEGAIAPGDLAAICDQAYATFHHPATAPLRQLTPGAQLLELFHGPSLAFKDVAMQVLARLYEHVLAASGRTLTIVCATSGDTGGAAVEAFRGRANIRIVALFPEGRISEVQRRFMTTARDSNVRALAVAGDFDACQAVLKALFRDEPFAKEVNLSAVNSINFVRIAAQCVYYFTAAVALGAPDREVSFVVPTGNFGDAFAGWAARRMGLPIGRIFAATNRNDILARALETGIYERGILSPTQSPAMDIQVASNFERLYFEACGRDGAGTRRAFEGFDQGGALTIPPEVLAAMRDTLSGLSASEAETSEAMSTAQRDGRGFLDPHTAVALAGSRTLSGSTTAPLVVLSTAHPAKFPEAVFAATGLVPPEPLIVGRLASEPERFDRIAADASAVKAYVRAFVAA